MKIGKCTARLVREAAVLGFLQGFLHGQAGNDKIPKDVWIVYQVLEGARAFSDLYPTLSRAQWPDDAVAAAMARFDQERLEMLKALINPGQGREDDR